MFGHLPKWWKALSARGRIGALGVLVIGLGGAWVYADRLDDGYGIEHWLFWKLCALWGRVLLFNLGCLSAGQLFLVRALKLRDLPALESAVMSMAAGVVLFALAMFAGGALAWYRPAFAIALAVTMVAAGAYDTWGLARRLWAEWHAPDSPNLLARAIGAAGVICVGIVYLGVLSPDALNYDATWSHVVIAQEYARAGRIIPFYADYNRNVPHLASLIYTWGYLMPEKHEPVRWMFALHSEFSLFVWTLAAVGAAIRLVLAEFGLRRGWVSFFLFPVIFVYDNNLGGASDHICGFFSVPIAIAALRLSERFLPGWAALLGLVSAGAVLTKLQALFVVLPAGAVVACYWLWQLARHRLPPRPGTAEPARPLASLQHLLWAPVITAAVGIAAFAPHTIRNYVFYSNPFYPFMQDVFVHSAPTVPNAAYYVRKALADPLYQPQGTFLEKLKHAAELFFTFSFVPHYSFTRNVPAFGSLFTLLFPALLFIRSLRVWSLAMIAAGAVLMWGFIYNVDRNLQAFMPVLVAVTGAILIACWRMGAIARIGLVPLVAVQLVWGGDALFYSQQERLVQAMDLIRTGYEGTAQRRWSVYREWHIALTKACPPNARVLVHTVLTSLALQREVLLDTVGFQGLIHYDHIETPRQLYTYFKTFGITHFLYEPHGPTAPTSQEEVVFDTFITTYAKQVMEIGAIRLLEMPSEPPPQEAPYRVASIGQEGYADGIYPIKALSTIRFLPEHERKYATPEEPLAEDRAQWPDQLRKVDAAIVQRGASVEGDAKNVLKREFTNIRNLRHDFTIYLNNKRVPGKLDP